VFAASHQSESEHTSADRRPPTADRRPPTADRRPPRLRFFLLLTLVSAAAVATAFVLANRSRLESIASNAAKETDAVNAAPGTPLQIHPLVQPLFAKDSPEAVCISRALQGVPQGPLNVSYCCHLLRLHGLGAFRHPRFASGREVVAALTDQVLSENLFGQPIFFQTRSGIRYRDITIQKIANGENHRDFVLAAFAESGLPLSTPLTAMDGAFTLRDLLRDSVENFDIKQKELAWTAIAYALYLPSQRGWTNRYKESFTFDEVANALMQTPLHKVSCGGAHLLDAMTILLRSDSSAACLSQSVRETLTKYLRQSVTTAVRAQSKNGSWFLDWYASGEEKSKVRRIAPPGASQMQLLVTGHLLEWLELLPMELQPSPDIYRRAAHWLGAALKEGFSVKSPDDFCPCIHAICSVRGLIGEFGE
jgi:hypothetical protein